MALPSGPAGDRGGDPKSAERFSTEGQLAELLELTTEEAEAFRSYVAQRGAEGLVEEVRDWVLAMLELYHGRAAAILTDYRASYTIIL